MSQTLEINNGICRTAEPSKLIINNAYNACAIEIAVADNDYSTDIILDRDQRDDLVKFLLDRGGVFSGDSLDDILGTFAIGCAYFGDILWRLRAADDPDIVALREELAGLHNKQLDLVGKIVELIKKKKEAKE